MMRLSIPAATASNDYNRLSIGISTHRWNRSININCSINGKPPRHRRPSQNPTAYRVVRKKVNITLYAHGEIGPFRKRLASTITAVWVIILNTWSLEHCNDPGYSLPQLSHCSIMHVKHGCCTFYAPRCSDADRERTAVKTLHQQTSLNASSAQLCSSALQ